MSSTVTAAALVERWVPRVGMTQLRCGFGYDAADPFAVTLDLGEDGAAQRLWVFDRSLLSDGLESSAGEGDVRVWRVRSRDSPVVAIVLGGRSRGIHLYAPLAALVAFLASTHEAVPPGTELEHVDLDGELAALLGADET